MHDRELAIAIGDMVVAWASVDGSLHDITRKITGMSYAMVADIFARVPTFESKTRIVRTLIAEWARPGPDAEKAAAAIEKISKLSLTRNSWVHGTWAAAFTNPPITVIFDPRKPKGARGRKTIKAHDVVQHVQTLHHRLIELQVTVQALQPKSDKPQL